MRQNMKKGVHKILSFVLALCMLVGTIVTDSVSVNAASDNSDVVFYDIEDESSYLQSTSLDMLLDVTATDNQIATVATDGDDVTYFINGFATNADGLHLDLGTSGDQRETKLHNETYFEMDKYLEQTAGEINNQNIYDVYLEQTLVDTDHPTVIENPAPEGQNVILIIDQSSSMASDTRINGMNSATAKFFAKIKKINDKRLEDARNGVYTDVNPYLDVEAQMEDRMIRVSGIIGYNNHIYKRYRNVNGLPVTSNAAVTTLSNAAKLKNDLSSYLAGNKNADMQEMTRTDMAMVQAETWVNEEGNPENSYVVLVTDGCPTLKDEWGWHMNLPLWGGSFNMSSTNTNDALRSARRMKDTGVTIESLYLGWGDSSLVAKAYETGNIGDVPLNDDCYGIMPIFLSLISSDYPKNGTFGTNGERFNHTYTYGNDARNRFGQYLYLAKDTDKLAEYLEAIPAKADVIAKANIQTGYATGSSVVQDVISMPFEKRTGSDIYVYKVPWIPANLGRNGVPTDIDENGEVAEFRWGRKSYIEGNTTVSEWIDVTDEVSISIIGNTVRVTGFDYEANAVTNYDKDTIAAWPKPDATVYEEGDYGYKLVVVIPINAKITFGGNNIATNNQDSTQFYPSLPTGIDDEGNEWLEPWLDNSDLNPNGHDYVEKYPVPKVDLNVAYDIVSDDIVIYAPQTAKLRNLVTDTYDNLWYVDDAYYDVYTTAVNAESEYIEAETAFILYEAQYGKIENPTAADLKTLMDLEVDMTLKLEVYEKALAELDTVADYTPNGINNQFVDITYELKDPDGIVVGTMYIPHGKAYNDKNIDWVFTDGDNAIITKSGEYTVSATITPVDTRRAPGGLVYTELDEATVQQNIGYSSEQYSSTGSTANGSQSAKSFSEKATAYLYYLKITTTDSRLRPRQALDFSLGGETLLDSSNLHLVDFEWVCTDGVTESISDNEPGITGLRKVGSGVTMISQIPEQAEDEGLVGNIGGTVAVTAPDGGYVPVSVILTRSIGDLNKDSDDQYLQTNVYMTDNDDIWNNGFNSVVWSHTCTVITDHDCNDEEFDDSQKYNTSENANGRGQVHYLIHVLDNPMPEISKTTSTPAITKGEDIKWEVVVENDNLAENPNRRNSVFSVVDVLPWVGDGRIDPNTNHEGSQFSGALFYKLIVADFSNAASALAAYENGTRVMYYTTDVKVRNASESQLLGTAATGNIKWTKISGTVDGTNVSFALPSNAVAMKFDTQLNWNESVSFDMTANMVNNDDQRANDYYHNQAMVLNGNGARLSEVVVTVVTNLYLSGMVWEDADSNGIATATEKRLDDIVVTLYQLHNPNNPNPVDRTVDGVKLIRAYDTNGDKYPQIATGTDGSYRFDDIQPGTYYVVADYIPEEYAVTEKEAGLGNVNTEALDSECEEEFVNHDVMKESTAWITKVVVKDKGVPNQNYGLTLITGNVRIGKTLDEIYYPTTMSDEERADYRVNFVFTLKNKTTGAVYSQAVYLNEDTMSLKDGYPQVWAEFTDLPLGTYELMEVSEASYQISNVTSDSNSVRFNKSTGITTIPVTSAEHDFEVYVENAMNQDPPGGDENGIRNWINMRIPVKLEVIYVGDDPISSNTLTEYTFVESDFSPAKGGDMIVTYDDGSTISLSDGTLDFADIQLEPVTVTNDMNSGDDKITVTGYYAEKGRLLTDSYRVAVDLKPIHKFQLNFDANGSRFDDRTTLNKVMFGYDERKNQNFVTMGTYKDVDNTGLNVLNGFWFGGWNTQNDGQGIQYDDVAALNAIGKDSTISTLTLYANWRCNVTFDAQGGKMANGTTSEEKALNGKGSGNITVSRNQKLSTTLTASKTNYDFVLWNTKKDGTGKNLEDYGPITGPVTFYAIYYQKEYYYTGTVQTFIAPVDGWYKVQLWGAQGGRDDLGEPNYGGKGAYVTGEVYVRASTKLYVVVGAPGIDEATGVGAGYNGGANPGSSGWSGSGGGATDVRTVYSSLWNDSSSLKSRIAVAAGGGGGGANGVGGYGGALIGGAGGNRGGTQTSAGTNGGFGYGGTPSPDGGGGGGGWYGGGAGMGDIGGGGGSSYLAGFGGCASSYTGYTFRNGNMIAGNATMPRPDGGTEVGHAGACRARIELIEVD